MRGAMPPLLNAPSCRDDQLKESKGATLHLLSSIILRLSIVFLGLFMCQLHMLHSAGWQGNIF
jgi:hypothetical protein